MEEKDLINQIRSDLKLDAKSEVVNESYVAQPKQYDLPGESVTKVVKDEHRQLYAGYVKSLNEVSAQLDTVKRGDAGPNCSAMRSLKQDETYNLNAVYLHELMFANCFDPHSECFLDSLPYMRLQRDWGKFEDWQRDFIGTALSSREGWIITGYSTFLRRYVNVFVDLHSTNVPVGLYPVIVIDMWTHAYARDFGNDRKAYLVSQMRELNWTTIEERFKRAEKIEEALR